MTCLPRTGFAGIGLLSAAAAATFSSGCGGTDAGAGAVVSDSAGVRIVHVDRDRAPFVAVDTIPDLVIGDRTDFSDLEFFGIRDVAVLNDELLLIAEGSTQQVIRIDLRDRGVTRFGLAGDGPAEFRGLSRLLPGTNGHVFAVDGRRRRMVEITDRGEPVREIAFPDVGRPGDRLLVEPAGPVSPENAYIAIHPAVWTESRDGPYRDRGAIVRLLDPADTLAVFPGATVFASGGATGGVVFGATTLITGDADGIWVGDTNRQSVELVTPGRGVTRVVRWTTAASRVLDGARIAEFWQRIEDGLPPAQRAAIPAMKSMVPFADSIPAFGSLVAGHRTLWIGSLHPPEAEMLEEPMPPQTWLVVDHDTGHTTQLMLPAGFELRHVARDYVLGIHRDELGLETIRRYRVQVHGT